MVRMKIREALKKIRGTDKKISSKEVGMYAQDFESLCHWVFVNELEPRAQEYWKIRDARDWKVDRKKND